MLKAAEVERVATELLTIADQADYSFALTRSGVEAGFVVVGGGHGIIKGEEWLGGIAFSQSMTTDPFEAGQISVEVARQLQAKYQALAEGVRHG